MGSDKFIVAPNARLAPGLGLQIFTPKGFKVLRVTHAFERRIFALPYTGADDARQARRPRALTVRSIERSIKSGQIKKVKISLPKEFLRHLSQEDRAEIEAAWSMIEPLLRSLSTQDALSSRSMSALIDARASELSASPTTVRRLLLRYYFYGCDKRGLLGRRRGPSPGRNSYRSLRKAGVEPKRRGRQSVLAKTRGLNKFVVSEADITRMVACYEHCLKRGVTHKTDAHEEYLAKYFSKDHPKVFDQYVRKDGKEPVTYRQFSAYIAEYGQLSEDLERNLPGGVPRRRKTGKSRSPGPGAIYEADATGGRIFLVDESDPPVVLGTPVIYLLVDRDSRFVPGVYVSLKAASWEELRVALLISFTSRSRRFKALGIDVDDEEWPVGRPCAVLTTDRGSDFLSEQMAIAAADGLRIEVDTLPPLCPDGKAIIERLIRELKRRMSRRLRGAFARRPTDPRARRTAQQARAVACQSLRELYAVVIKIILEHNKRPHTALRRRTDLIRAAVAPVPEKAYLWGLKNITGVQQPPLTDEEYRRILLHAQPGVIQDGVLRIERDRYLPADAAARRLIESVRRGKREVLTRRDKTDPVEAFHEDARGNWSCFTMDVDSKARLMKASLMEQEALESESLRLWATADTDSRIGRVLQRMPVASPKSRQTPREAAPSYVRSRRTAETQGVKRALSAGVTTGAPKDQKRKSVSADDEWMERVRQEREQTIAFVTKRTRK